VSGGTALKAFMGVSLVAMIFSFGGLVGSSTASNDLSEKICLSYDVTDGSCAGTVTIEQLIEEARNATNN